MIRTFVTALFGCAFIATPQSGGAQSSRFSLDAGLGLLSSSGGELTDRNTSVGASLGGGSLSAKYPRSTSAGYRERSSTLIVGAYVAYHITDMFWLSVNGRWREVRHLEPDVRHVREWTVGLRVQ
ncbi:MAG: hypothetical protein ABI969_07215 [bacterium]